MTWTDWTRRRCYVEPAEGGGKARRLTPGAGGAGFALARATRDVLLGADPPGRRGAGRGASGPRGCRPGGTVIVRDGGDVRWWTWAGYRANATLRGDLSREMWRAAVAGAVERLCLLDVDERALAGLKFSEALPRHLAAATLAARLADLDGAGQVLREPVSFAQNDEQR